MAISVAVVHSEHVLPWRATAQRALVPLVLQHRPVPLARDAILSLVVFVSRVVHYRLDSGNGFPFIPGTDFALSFPNVPTS
jgi:hypothetical protein